MEVKKPDDRSKMFSNWSEKTIIIEHGISTRVVVTIISIIAVINCWMILGSWVFTTYYRYDLAGNWDAGSAVKYILVQFHLSNEMVIASWYSSMLLLLTASAAFLCFLTDQRTILRSNKNYFLKHGWFAITLIFTLLSADELGSYHERIGMIPALNLLDDTATGWVRALAIPIGLVAIYILWFSWKRLKRNPLVFSFMLLGLFAYLLNPFLEEAEMALLDSSMGTPALKQHDLFILIEEGAELFGTLCFFSAAIIYLTWKTRQGSKAATKAPLQKGLIIPFKTVFVGVVGLFTLFSLAMLMLYLTGFREIKDTGIPENWFPSAIAGFDAILCFYLWKYLPEKEIALRTSFFLVALFCVFMSAAYGINLKGWLLMREVPKHIPNIVNFCLIFFALALTFPSVLTIRNKWHVLGLLAWASTFSAAIYFGNKYFAGYLDLVAFSILLLMLLFHLEYWQTSAFLLKKITHGCHAQ